MRDADRHGKTAAVTDPLESGLIRPHSFSLRATAGQVHLRLLETTDLHVHIFPYDYYADRPVDTVGLARTATQIDRVRTEAAQSVLLDNGDLIQGNPMGDYIAYERGLKPGDLHPIIAAMNAVGYDAATVGNHEFNYGLDFLKTAMAGARFPIVLANVATRIGAGPRADRTLFKPYVILDREVRDGAGTPHRLRLGVLGLTAPQIMIWDRRHLAGKVTARDMVETARSFVPEMKEAGCDLIVALCHSGIGPDRHSDGMENAGLPLAAVEWIDVLLTGHQHRTFPGPQFRQSAAVDPVRGTLHGKPAVMGGFWGSDLGVIDLLLETSGGDWRIADFASTTRPISQRSQDRSVQPLVGSEPAVEEAVADTHRATLAFIRRPVGKTTAPLHSYFALVADNASVQFVAMA